MPTRKKYKKWLVTGGAGFIGSAMIRDLLLDPSLHILNIDALTYAGNLSSLPSSSEHPHYTFLKADVADVDHMKRVFLEFQPDCVIHFAAESHVDRSIDGPADFLKTNIWGTFSLLEAARGYLKVHPEKKDSFRFHHISTDEVFGTLPREGKFSEKTAYDPRSPYSATKAGSDHLVRAWYHTYDIPITISNCSNNYGPFHFPEKLIPLAILSALHNQPINVYGDGKNVRDWLYVEDHIRAIQLVLAQGKVGETYVVGGHGEKTNIEVVQLICALLDKKFHRTAQNSFSKQIAFVSDRPGHDSRYAIDPHKIQTDLGWRPQKTFDQGISDTIDWYVDNPWWWEPIWSQKHPGKRLGIV